MIGFMVPALLASVLAMSPKDQAYIEFADLASAWASGESRWAASVFETAWDHASQSECAYSPYSAQLAYRIGLLKQSGYHFHIALHIDEVVSGLTQRQLEVAEEFRSEPGELQSEDQFFLSSPYLSGSVAGDVCLDRGLGALPDVQSGLGDSAHLYARVEWRGRRASRVLESVEVLDSYPPVEGESLAARLIGMRQYRTNPGWVIEAFTFAPCYRYGHRQTLYEICRSSVTLDSPQ